MTNKGTRDYKCRVCGEPGYAKGLCERDYARERRGTPQQVSPHRVTSVDEAFCVYASTRNNNGCIEWSGARDACGYGIISINKRNHKAHRVALARSGVQVPPGAFVLHSCDNPPCVNPDQLSCGDAAINVADMVSKGRQARGFANARRRLTDSAVDEIRTANESATSLAMRHGISRQYVYKIRSGAQIPWRRVIGPIHPDDKPLTGDTK